MRPNPRPQEMYRHFKGNIYQIRCLAKHSETGEMMVVYQAMYDTFQIYVRPLAMFMEEVDVEKYPDARQQYRFELLQDSERSIEEIIARVGYQSRSYFYDMFRKEYGITPAQYRKRMQAEKEGDE